MVRSAPRRRSIRSWVSAGLAGLLLPCLPPAALGYGTLADVTPLILPMNPFTDFQSEDNDWDCMDDGAEHLLASQFKPYFIFDGRENARRPGEPVVIYRVKTGYSRKMRCGASTPSTIVIYYAYLFRDDGGYTESWYCGDSHAGDDQLLKVTVKVEATREGYRFSPVKVYGGDGPAEEMEWLGNQYPTLYLSSGKHHSFIDMSWDDAGDSPFSEWYCNEGVNGMGAQVLPKVASAAAPHGRHNVGEPDEHPAEHFVNDLTALGFPGENAWSTTPFCGGYGVAHITQCTRAATSPITDLWK